MDGWYIRDMKSIQFKIFKDVMQHNITSLSTQTCEILRVNAKTSGICRKSRKPRFSTENLGFYFQTRTFPMLNPYLTRAEPVLYPYFTRTNPYFYNLLQGWIKTSGFVLKKRLFFHTPGILRVWKLKVCHCLRESLAMQQKSQGISGGRRSRSPEKREPGPRGLWHCRLFPSVPYSWV